MLRFITTSMIFFGSAAISRMSPFPHKYEDKKVPLGLKCSVGSTIRSRGESVNHYPCTKKRKKEVFQKVKKKEVNWLLVEQIRECGWFFSEGSMAEKVYFDICFHFNELQWVHRATSHFYSMDESKGHSYFSQVSVLLLSFLKQFEFKYFE